MHQVAMTKQGRALMRWVTKPRAPRTKVALKERAAEVLGQLYDASSSRKGYLDWARSPTIDKELIPRGLARSRGAYLGFEITEEGVARSLAPRVKGRGRTSSVTAALRGKGIPGEVP
ncbi:hypothetical protein ACFY20_45465 [Streptomyces sp. NPDC001312]|uniref:hypothetical protein n=1 Tax=Streptomyces sp. NPDC001312 TaxID=3364561 RepID=UPI0036C5FA5C